MISRGLALVFGFCLACGSAWSPRTGGEMGKADFAYLGFSGSANLARAFLVGTDVTLRIQLYGDVRDGAIVVKSADEATFAVSSFGRTTDRGEWQAVVHGVKVGTAKLAVDGVDGKPLDTVSLSVGEPAKIVAPESLVTSVGNRQRFEARVDDKDGRELYAASSLEWTLDVDVATFDSRLGQQTGPTRELGTIVDLRGNRPGSTLLHGRVGNAKVEINVTVK